MPRCSPFCQKAWVLPMSQSPQKLADYHSVMHSGARGRTALLQMLHTFYVRVITLCLFYRKRFGK